MNYKYSALILLIIIIFSDLIKTAYFKFVELNMCLDTGICSKGIITRVDGNLVEINEENCKKYNKTWNPKNRTCNIRLY